MRMLDTIERVGNALPSPATIFVILGIVTLAASAICALLGVSVTYDVFNATARAFEKKTVAVVNLLSADGVRHLVTSVVKNFTTFFPLGTVFTIIIGVSVAEGSGFLAALLKKVVAITPRFLVSAVVVFLGVMSNIADRKSVV